MSFPTPEEKRENEVGRLPHADRLDEPIRDVMESGEEPKSWDRASIKLFTHPLHPRPRLTSDDLVFPRHADRLRALGDAAIFAACVIGLAFFPLYIAYILVPGLSHWYWTVAPGAGIAGGAWAYTRIVSMSPEDYLAQHEGP